jgi:hypothetical protein
MLMSDSERAQVAALHAQLMAQFHEASDAHWIAKDANDGEALAKTRADIKRLYTEIKEVEFALAHNVLVP